MLYTIGSLTLRTNLYSNSPLIILGAGPHQVPYIKKCSSLGIDTIAIDSNANAIGKNHSTDFLHLEVSNANAVSIVKTLRSHLGKSRPRGVLCAGIELPILASAIASEFHLTSVSPETAKMCTEKIARKKALKDYLVPSPEYKICLPHNSYEIKKFPFVVKENEGSGARGVYIVREHSEYIKLLGSLDPNRKILLENYEEGDEFSVEAFIWEGKFYYYCFALRDFEQTDSGSLIEWGSISDPNFEASMVDAVKRVFESGCRALGIQAGPAKGDVMFTKSGARIIEIASRSAPLAPLIAKSVYGFDAVMAQILWAIGENPFQGSLRLVNLSNSLPVSHRILSHKKGVASSIKGVEYAKKSAGVLLLMKFFEENKFPLMLTDVSNTNRLLYVAATGNGAIQARHNANNALDKIKIDYNTA